MTDPCLCLYHNLIIRLRLNLYLIRFKKFCTIERSLEKKNIIFYHLQSCCQLFVIECSDSSIVWNFFTFLGNDRPTEQLTHQPTNHQMVKMEDVIDGRTRTNRAVPLKILIIYKDVHMLIYSYRLNAYHWKCYFPMTSYSVVGWPVCLFFIVSFKGGKLHFHRCVDWSTCYLKFNIPDSRWSDGLSVN